MVAAIVWWHLLLLGQCESVFVEANRDDNPCLVVEKSVGISIGKRTALDGFGCLMPTTEIDVSEVCLPSLAWPFRFVDQTVWQRKVDRDE